MRTHPLPFAIRRLKGEARRLALARLPLTRGPYREILAPEDTDLADPALAALDPRYEAFARVLHLIAKGLLPKDDREWTEREHGHSSATELYGFCAGLVLVQVREIRHERGKRPFKRLRYFVSDGETIVEVPGAIPRRVIGQNPDPAGPIVAVRASLPVAWQHLLPSVRPVKIKRS